jgi:hypothetical protein
MRRNHDRPGVRRVTRLGAALAAGVGVVVSIGFAPQGRAAAGAPRLAIAVHQQGSLDVREASFAERHSGVSHFWVRRLARRSHLRPRLREGVPAAAVPCAGQVDQSKRIMSVEADRFGREPRSSLASGAALAAALARLRGWS